MHEYTDNSHRQAELHYSAEPAQRPDSENKIISLKNQSLMEGVAPQRSVLRMPGREGENHRLILCLKDQVLDRGEALSKVNNANRELATESRAQQIARRAQRCCARKCGCIQKLSRRRATPRNKWFFNWLLN